MFSGIVTIMLCCFGHLSMKKAQGLLLMSLVVTVVNLINLLVLEVGEWRGFLSQADEDYINQYGLNYLMKSAYICTTLSTIVAMVASFLGTKFNIIRCIVVLFDLPRVYIKGYIGLSMYTHPFTFKQN